MIAITNASNQVLQLGDGQHLTIERIAAWLTDDDLPGDFSYPITIPLNENNRRFVAQSYRPDAARPRYTMPVTVSFSDILYRSCTMVYTKKGDKLSVVLHIDGGEVAASLAKKNLADIFDPEWLKLGDELDLSGQTPKKSPAQCMLEIAQKPVGTHPFTFFPIRNEAFWEDNLAGKIDGFAVRTYVNSWEKLPSGQAGFRLDSEGSYGFVAVPQFYLFWVLQQIMALAGYRIESDWLARPEIQRLTILNMTGLIPPFLLSGHYVPVGMCLPDMSVADFLKAIKGRFGLVYAYNANDRVCQIAQFSTSVNAGPAIDLTPFQSGGYDTDKPRDTGFTLTEFLDENDQQYVGVDGKRLTPNSVSLGKAGEQIPLRVGTTQQTYAESPLSPGAQWLTPTVRIAGNTFDTRFAESDRFIKEKKRPNGIGLQLLSYYGMQPDSMGQLYPFASPDVRNARQEVVGTQALTLRGRNGAWRQYLRPYYYFRDQSIPVVQPLLLPVAILSKLLLHRTVGLTLSRSVTNSYLPIKLQADTPGPDGKALVRLECQTLPGGIGLSADVDEPLVWLELIQETTRTSDTVELLEEKTCLTIKAWADKNRTAPATVSSLPIGIRMKRTYNLLDLASYTPPAKIQEYVQAYVLVSNQQIVESALTTRITRIQLPANLVEDYQTSVQLDPGDGYYVLL